jgi:hypothetical protein
LLRSPDVDTFSAAYVSTLGVDGGVNVNYTQGVGVRPALWLYLE